jgi:beta-lactamase class A
MMLAAWLVVAASSFCNPNVLMDEMRTLAATARGRVGAAALLVEKGDLVTWNGTERFPMQSVYKLPIVMAALNLVDEGKLQLDQSVTIFKSDLPPKSIYSPIRDAHPDGGFSLSVTELARAAIADSDGGASDVLLKIIGTDEVMQYLHRLKILDMTVATSEAEMAKAVDVQYKNWATPRGAIALLAALQEGHGLSSASRRLLLEWMTESKPGAHRIKGALPEGTPVAHKTGTSGSSNGVTQATNDIGLVTLPDGTHLAIAVFVSDSRANEEAREGAIARIARAEWDCWSPKKLVSYRPTTIR